MISGVFMPTNISLFIILGSKYGFKFRSPAEFAFHAKWLCEGCPVDEGRHLCGCKYCGENVNQGEISRRWFGLTPSDRHNVRNNKHFGKASKRQSKKEQKVVFKDYTVLATVDRVSCLIIY